MNVTLNISDVINNLLSMGGVWMTILVCLLAWVCWMVYRYINTKTAMSAKLDEINIKKKELALRKEEAIFTQEQEIAKNQAFLKLNKDMLDDVRRMKPILDKIEKGFPEHAQSCSTLNGETLNKLSFIEEEVSEMKTIIQSMQDTIKDYMHTKPKTNEVIPKENIENS